MAQLVFTATGTPKVDSVLFAIEGTLKEVPVDDGSLSAQPLTRFSYPSLDPIRLPPPTPGGGLPTTTTTTTTVPPAPATTAAAPSDDMTGPAQCAALPEEHFGDAVEERRVDCLQAAHRV